MQTLWQDLRYGARMLMKRPGFTLIAVLTLALGIGATTAIFSVVDGVLLRSLPFPHSERIVQLREVSERGVGIRFAEPNFQDVRARQRTLEAVAQFAGGRIVVSGGRESLQTSAYWVSGDFFRVLGVQPALGRSFLPEESKPGAGAFVAVVSHGFWQRQLGGRTDFSNVKLNVDGPSFTVVGVMPPGGGYLGSARSRRPAKFAHRAQLERHRSR
jgi:putative ABC transport system permease protein